MSSKTPLDGLPAPLEQALRNIVSLIASLDLTNAVLWVLIKNHANYAEIQEVLKDCRKG